MNRSTRQSSPARRDAALRRLRVANRTLIGAAVLGTGLLTDVTANAFSGHSRHVTTTAAAKASAVAAAPRASRHRRHHRRAHHHGLRAPAHPPTSTSASRTTSTATQSAPAPATTTQAAPAAQPTTQAAPAPQPTTQAAPTPAPQPAPVVSGGS
jgi:hypothetical protein